MSKSISKTEKWECRVSPEENNRLSEIARKAGVKKSDILRVAVDVFKSSFSSELSSVKKKVFLAKKKGEKVSLRDILDIDTQAIDSRINSGVFSEVLKKRKK